MQVEQTTERMRKWGGQHIETEKTAGPQSPKGLRAKIYA